MCLPLRFLWSIALVASLLPLSGCGETPAAIAPTPPRVTVQSPEARQLTKYVEYNGWIDSEKTVDIRARVRGHIQKISFTDGQIVSAGDVLFELDPRPFLSDIERANEQLKIFQAQHVAAEKDAVRLRELLGKGGASQAQVEKAEADTLSLAAQISGAEEEVRRRELELSYSKVTAEIDGKVGRAMLQEGNLVNAGGSDPVLTTVVAINPVRVYFSVDERILLQYARNMGAEGKNPTEMMAHLKDVESPFTFALDGEKDFSHRGVLRFGDNRIDPTTGTLQIYGAVDNSEGKLLPGARVRVRVPVGKPYASLLVPETAILSDQTERYVLIADKDDNVRRRDVELGELTDDGMREIRVKAADSQDTPDKWSVLVDNLQRARLNYPIEPQKPATATPTAAPAPSS
jgi:RND family efflux transporter MFP subunit